mmetsp:Transcript_11595/g.16316  ORF Transcript_11595/g.16316 Transcript_11595/m.16316 type:complete len:209 (-) Transcript_11595:106-732(-)
MRTQARSKHASTPWPPSLYQIVIRAGGQLHDIQASMIGLLFSRVRDLRHRRHFPFARLANAAIVTIAHSKDGAIRPNLPTQGGLLGDLQVLIEVNPTASTRTLVRQGVGRHEVVGGLDADANVDLIRTIGKLDLLPKLRVLRVVLAVVELLDPHRRHVLGAVLCSAIGQGTQATREEVDDGDLQLWKEMLKFRGPLHSDKSSAHDQNS